MTTSLSESICGTVADLNAQARYWWRKGRQEWEDDGVISVNTMFFLTSYFNVSYDEVIDHYADEFEVEQWEAELEELEDDDDYC